MARSMKCDARTAPYLASALSEIGRSLVVQNAALITRLAICREWISILQYSSWFKAKQFFFYRSCLIQSFMRANGARFSSLSDRRRNWFVELQRFYLIKADWVSQSSQSVHIEPFLSFGLVSGPTFWTKHIQHMQIVWKKKKFKKTLEKHLLSPKLFCSVLFPKGTTISDGPGTYYTEGLVLLSFVFMPL